MFSTQKGITLIALVITIIVLLILAGVTITLALNGGIITQAQDSTSKYNKEKALEILDIAVADVTAEELAHPEWPYLTYGAAAQKLGDRLPESDFIVTEGSGCVNVQFINVEGLNYRYIAITNGKILSVHESGPH